MMSWTSLGNALLESRGVRDHMQRLLRRSVAREFPAVVATEQAGLSPGDRELLLMWASALSLGEGAGVQDAALRIAFDVLLDLEAAPVERLACEVLLQRLSNEPGRELAQRRLGRAENRDLPLFLEMERTRHQVADGITLSSGSFITANRFQRSLWDTLQATQIIGASAPTSAGKSFILMRWLEECIRQGDRSSIVYLVPTRALVGEIEAAASDHVAKTGLNQVWVTSIPSTLPDGVEVEVVVATQERLHLLLRDRMDWAPDLLIVDEAQKMSEGRRGVLLQQVVAEVLGRNPDCQAVMAGPQLENPEVFMDVGPANATRRPMSRDDVTVVQNLLWAEQVPRKPAAWTVSGFYFGETVHVGTFSLPEAAGSPGKRLPLVALALAGRSAGNVLYANGAAEAEKYAKLLSDGSRVEPGASEKAALDDVVKLVQDAIHPRFVLAEQLRKGVAFHYGNLPTVVRSEVERLFRENIVKWLVCTSTLMEGVNLPCRNLFVRGPKKGLGIPMKEADFWNLAGRAGRWGVEFAGNVICVDPNDRALWPDGAPKRRVPQRVVPVSQAVLGNPEALLAYLSDGAPACGEGDRAELEGIYSQMASIVRRGRGLRDMAWTAGVSNEVVGRVEDAVRELDAGLTIPEQLIFRNPGISPTGIEGLLSAFRDSAEFVEELVPVPVEDSEAVKSLAGLMEWCDRHLGDVFGVEAHRFSTAIVTVAWMRGKPLRSIIESKLDYLSHRSTPFSFGTAIRQVLDDVEQYARYRVPKYVGCYADVLRHFLVEELGDTELAAQIPDYSEALEFGVSQRTHMSLMKLGFSRYSAIAVSEFIHSNEMTPQQCLLWLQDFDAAAYGLPSVVVREVDQAVATRGVLIGRRGPPHGL